MFTILMILVLLACVGVKYSHSRFSWSDYADSKALAQHKELAKSMNSSWPRIFASVICVVLRIAYLVEVTATTRKANSGTKDGSVVRSETA